MGLKKVSKYSLKRLFSYYKIRLAQNSLIVQLIILCFILCNIPITSFIYLDYLLLSCELDTKLRQYWAYSQQSILFKPSRISLFAGFHLNTQERGEWVGIVLSILICFVNVFFLVIFQLFFTPPLFPPASPRPMHAFLPKKWSSWF